ncbi:nitric oxide synthase oxygenase [Bacillus sp. PS06]|uniref:nitric oxide synthase oxygenase n=1 Tax=Bacillus sp. PS06 TaxID=2764176 RepID=UPI00178569A5|nr:nitric oxide synthase oxygenase [Bacillus sp. PS06]MBD8068014.1 nitric oxide synthase oxygenase [Bacillus sp. PS06]
MFDNEELYKKAEDFITICYAELNKGEEERQKRMEQIHSEIVNTATYLHTYEELEHGAKMAWRNSNRCIGRLFWNSLTVFDKRNLQREEDVFNALCEHIQFATNGGKVLPTITIFRQQTNTTNSVYIWNHQLIRYAGYETEHGTLGDPSSISLTKKCEELGWERDGTDYDILPIVIEIDGQAPKLFQLPTEIISEVDIVHPQFDWFKELGVKWYGVPFISDMELEIGGIRYTAAPFNGWYMGTEIGARNLADQKRYNLLPIIADHMELDMSSNASLWKDKALLELNIAVLYSYKKVGISIVDHHTAAQQFSHFEEKERKADRDLTGDWTWLIPPMSPAVTHIFHTKYNNKKNNPNYYYRKVKIF